jgi:hypothetical protein
VSDLICSLLTNDPTTDFILSPLILLKYIDYEKLSFNRFNLLS